MPESTSSGPRVALVKGDDRYSNVTRALELVEKDIDLSRARKILIKPNLTHVHRQLAATHVDALRAVLDFLVPRTSAQIVIAEAAGVGSTGAMIGFKNFGYFALGERHWVRFMDLNTDAPVEAQVFDWKLRPLTIRLAKTVVNADLRISVSPPKTHDVVIVTASLKNLLMGSILRTEHWVVGKLLALGSRVLSGTKGDANIPISGRLATWVGHFTSNDKLKMHQGYPAMNLSLYKLAKVIPPHLSIVDGFEAMEGVGPADGERVDLGVAIASTDYVAADSLAARLMGLDVNQIGYLFYCWKKGLGEADVSKMNLLGERPEDCARAFKPHPDYEAQLKWQVADFEKYLE